MNQSHLGLCRSFSTSVYHLLPPLLLLLVSGSLSRPMMAQGLQPRPVARLITESAEDTAYTRPGSVTVPAPYSSLHAPARTPAATSPSLDDATSIERRTFAVTNAMRRQNGLAELSWDSDLCRMARIHSENMARLKFFSHETPEGSHLKDRAHEAGVLHWRVIGENIAYNQDCDDPGGLAVERWMSSPGHRANLLYRGFQASAVGSFVAANGRIYITQIFITR